MDGWFPTGDVTSIEVDGYLTIHERFKDIIKSGGEWISLVTLENIAVAHPDLTEAAVIGARHAKWGELLVLIAVARAGTRPNPAKVMAILVHQLVMAAIKPSLREPVLYSSQSQTSARMESINTQKPHSPIATRGFIVSESQGRPGIVVK